MNFFTKPMKLLTAVVLRSTSDAVSESLLQTGAMDFIDVKSLEDMELDSKVSAFEPSEGSSELATKADGLLKQLQGIYSQGMLVPPRMNSDQIKNIEGFDIGSASSKVKSIGDELLASKQLQKDAGMRYQSFEEIDHYLKEGKDGYLDIRAGHFTKEVDSIQAKFPDVEIGFFPLDGSSSVMVSLRRDASKINPMMDKLGWIESDDASIQKLARQKAPQLIAFQAQELSKEADKASSDTSRLIQSRKAEMDELYRQLLVLKLCSKIKDYFQNTKNTAVFSGWVPADKARQIEADIRRTTGGQCIIEWTEASDVKGVPVPVEMESPKVLAPFSRIVNNYSTPQYGTVNPVIFTTIAFMCMFGLMFADVGQGLVILLIGVLGSLAYKKNPLKKEGIITNNLCHLLVYLGASSMLFGALFGSYFGYSWLPGIWFNFDAVVEGEAPAGSLVKDIYGILGITIRFGFIVIVTGLVLNWINLIRRRQWVDLVMDKYGILGGWIYIVGFWGCSYFVKSGYKSFPPGSFFLIAIMVPAVLMLGRGLMDTLVNHAPFKLGLMDWLVSLLEVFSGYLSNTLSFMRVAGLGIAHASLMTAFKTMAAMTTNPVFIFLIMALGNVLVIGIEGLSAGIQALRLNYYEFFTKFFTGKGVAYKPVNIEE